MPNIVFFGTEAFSLEALKALVENDYDVDAVVTKPDSQHGRGMQLHAPVVKSYALEHGLQVLQPERLSEIEAEIAAIPDRLGVLSSYGKIIPESILSLFERGIVNIHPSLLPKYRGPSPIETAIINGDTETGVSLMRLVAQMDAGPVYVQTKLQIDAQTSASDLYKKCAQTGSALLVESLPLIINGQLFPTPQDETQATYTALLHKHDAHVDPAHQTATEIERHIRAYEEYPRTRLTIHGHEVIILSAHVGEPAAHDLVIHCAHGTKLIIDRLIAPSGRTVSGADFQRGYGE